MLQLGLTASRAMLQRAAELSGNFSEHEIDIDLVPPKNVLKSEMYV